MVELVTVSVPKALCTPAPPVYFVVFSEMVELVTVSVPKVLNTPPPPSSE